jgi:hypothetical protein
MVHRLVLLVGPSGSRKTETLREFAGRAALPLVNLNLALSERLLDIATSRRPLHVSELCESILSEAGSEAVCADNTELLFSTDLKINVLQLLQRLSRNRTLVMSWRGTWDGRALYYAAPGHPEYRSYQDVDAVIVASAEPSTPTLLKS